MSTPSSAREKPISPGATNDAVARSPPCAFERNGARCRDQKTRVSVLRTFQPAEIADRIARVEITRSRGDGGVRAGPEGGHCSYERSPHVLTSAAAQPARGVPVEATRR